MKGYRVVFVVILGLCLVSQASWAEKAYVTDSLKITLRTGPSIENKIIAMLSSGQSVEVMGSEGDWSQVWVLENGESTKEGWVLSRFLISRLPWETRARALIEENTTLKEKLTPLENELKETVRQEADLTAKLRESNQALRQLKEEFESLKRGAAGYLKLKKEHEVTQAKLDTVQKQVQELNDENKSLRSSQRHKWFAAGALVLLAGLILGLVMGRREKRRHSSLYY